MSKETKLAAASALLLAAASAPLLQTAEAHPGAHLKAVASADTLTRGVALETIGSSVFLDDFQDSLSTEPIETVEGVAAGIKAKAAEDKKQPEPESGKAGKVVASLNKARPAEKEEAETEPVIEEVEAVEVKTEKAPEDVVCEPLEEPVAKAKTAARPETPAEETQAPAETVKPDLEEPEENTDVPLEPEAALPEPVVTPLTTVKPEKTENETSSVLLNTEIETPSVSDTQPEAPAEGEPPVPEPSESQKPAAEETQTPPAEEVQPPVVEEPETPVMDPVEEEPTETETPELPIQTPAPSETPEPVETPTPSQNPYSQLNQAIAQSALGLVGVTDGWQCTEVVQQALAGAGVSDAMCLWPDQYQPTYGYYTDTPEAGNLIYYNNGGRGVDHIAVYIGDGQAVHGNFMTEDGSKTVVATADVGPGAAQYIQVERSMY